MQVLNGFFDFLKFVGLIVVSLPVVAGLAWILAWPFRIERRLDNHRDHINKLINRVDALERK